MHEGHRQRMRGRFIQSGLDGFAPHEVLELLLFHCIPQRDVNPLAHDLLNTFGSLHGVFEATPAQLKQVKGIGENAAVFLSLVSAVTRRYQDSLSAQKPVIKTRADAESFCRSLFIGLKTEHFYLVALDAGMRLIGKTLIAKGSLSEVPAYPRAVMEAALALSAHSVILCHNHPGGSAAPSDSDVQMTRQLMHMLAQVDVKVLDHLIVSGQAVLNMSQFGYDNKGDSAMPFAADDPKPKRPIP